MTKAEIKSMTNEELIFEFGFYSFLMEKPSKKNKKATDDIMQEMHKRGLIDYEKMIAYGAKRCLWADDYKEWMNK